ncbi:MAG: glutaredoxin family protein [Gammaproteobacteria bacterium]
MALVAAFGTVTWLTRAPTIPPVYCDEAQSPGRDTVVMLSASWCGYCRAARAFFVREGIRYCEYDVEQSARGAARHRALARQGVRGVPVILVDDALMVGFRPDDVRAALRARRLSNPKGVSGVH